MTAAEIIESAFLDGMSLVITAEGQVHYSGQEEVVARWLQAIRENKPEIVRLLKQDAVPATKAIVGEIGAASRWWRFHYTDREPKEASYSPAATHAQALAGEPDAITAEAFEPIRRKPTKLLSPYHQSKIKAWLRHIGETDESIVKKVIYQCNTDADARSCYLAMAQTLESLKGIENER